ncbi:MAG: hypothetical protein ETSY1_26325 [Candidatus Entotheonella factor]|uniref:Uncharacterized protein n=1 Tax=Entotheonella factor TaxID=1429438 RepID=W4LGQ1_ENTF1|nr:MAG: hypothetical protein ETSY1_26325 [Candidatus Entotheonella factor]
MFNVALWIKVTVNMTTLAVFRNDLITLIDRKVSPQGVIEGSGMTGREAQERTQRA